MKHPLMHVVAHAILVPTIMLGCGGPTHHGTLQIVNAAGAPVSGKLDLCGNWITIDKLAVGDSMTFHYDVEQCPRQDYHVIISSGTDKPLDIKIGYITGGFDFHDKITIRPSALDIEDKVGNILRDDGKTQQNLRLQGKPVN